MKVSFILPPVILKSAGGYKVVYQYANYLSQNKNEVTIYYWDRNGENSKKLPRFVVRLLRKILAMFEPTWMEIDNRINKRSISEISNKTIKDADVIICTSIDTVVPTFHLCESKGKKFNLIQGYENWFLDEAEVRKIYNMPINKIAVSKTLLKRIRKLTSTNIQLVSNGIDLKKFYPKKRNDKNNYSIAMMYKENSIKNSEFGLRVFYQLKNMYPELQINLFGTDKPTVNFPDWIEYHYRATEEDLLEIYNKSAVYCCTSIEEGFGLPSLESMACGCVLVSSKTMGAKEYGIDGENCLLYDVNSESDLYNTIVKLFDDFQLYQKLQINGLNLVKNNYSLNSSCEKFEKILLEN